MNRRLLNTAIVAASLFLAVPVVRAQSSVADSLARSLDNRDVHVRAAAVMQLDGLPKGDLSPAVRRALINLLEAEATGRGPVSADTLADGDETYGEYVISLSDLVFQLHDPAALRGLVLLGAQTSGDVMRFVASFGARSLPYLDEAWRINPNARQSVVMMRALATTVSGPNALSAADRQRIIASLIDVAETYPMDVARAARDASLVELAPVIVDVAARETSDIVKSMATKDVSELVPRRARTSVPALLERTASAVAGFCRAGGVEVERSTHDDRTDTDAPSTRPIACLAVWWGLKLSQADVAANRIDAAKAKLDFVARAAAHARTRAIFSPAEAALAQGNARYILTRV